MIEPLIQHRRAAEEPCKPLPSGLAKPKRKLREGAEDILLLPMVGACKEVESGKVTSAAQSSQLNILKTVAKVVCKGSRRIGF